MRLTHTSWREKEDLQKQTEEYGRAFGKVLKVVRDYCFIDFLAYYIQYLIIGYIKSLIKGNRKGWFEAARKGYRES